MRETSLDDFLGGDDADTGPSDTNADTDASAEPDRPETDDRKAGAGEATAGDGVEPAVSTYDWTPAGAACEVCGTAVERRWRDDGGLVCADCKTW